MARLYPAIPTEQPAKPCRLEAHATAADVDLAGILNRLGVSKAHATTTDMDAAGILGRNGLDGGALHGLRHDVSAPSGLDCLQTYCARPCEPPVNHVSLND